MKLILTLLSLYLGALTACKTASNNPADDGHLAGVVRVSDDPSWAYLRCWTSDRKERVWFEKFSTNAAKSKADPSRYQMKVLYKNINGNRDLDGAALNAGTRTPLNWDVEAEEKVGGGFIPNMKVKYRFDIRNSSRATESPDVSMDMYMSDQNGNLRMTEHPFFCATFN